jgi:Calcineurin-like phosphoesterase
LVIKCSQHQIAPLLMQSSRRDFLKISAGLVGLSACQSSRLSSGQTLRFAVASDGHYGQPKTEYKQYFENIIQYFEAEKASAKLDFCVFNGDLFHDDIAFLPEVKSYFDRLSMPYYVTRGNHDHATQAQWKATWGYETNHVVSAKNYGIILADTSNEKGEYLCPDVPWLDAQLAHLQPKKHVFLFAHIPYKRWSKHGVVCPEMEKVIAKYPNLRAAFHGHDHAIDEAQMAEIPFLFDGHFGGNWGVGYRGYRIVEVQPNGSISTYQFDPEKKVKMNEKMLVTAN